MLIYLKFEKTILFQNFNGNVYNFLKIFKIQIKISEFKFMFTLSILSSF